MFMRWCFWSHLVLPCTNWHQNKPMFSCLYLWGGAFTRILYFDVQTGTKTSLFLVVYVYEVVLLLASCTSMYKQAPNQTNFLVVYVYGMVLFLAFFTSMYKQAPKQTFFNLFMFTGWCFYSHLVLWCTNGTKPSRFLVVYVYGVVLLLVSCTSMYKQAPNQNFF